MVYPYGIFISRSCLMNSKMGRLVPASILETVDVKAPVQDENTIVQRDLIDGNGYKDRISSGWFGGGGDGAWCSLTTPPLTSLHPAWNFCRLFGSLSLS